MAYVFRQALFFKNNSTTNLIINILYQPMLLDWLSKYFADPFYLMLMRHRISHFQGNRIP